MIIFEIINQLITQWQRQLELISIWTFPWGDQGFSADLFISGSVYSFAQSFD